MILMVLTIASCTRAFHKWNADYVNDIKQEYQIQDASSRIANYEWFYDQYGAIQATRKKVILAKGTDTESGLKMVLETMVAEYNAKSRMTATKAKWKAENLPYEILDSMGKEGD